jgi:hypothetical protein
LGGEDEGLAGFGGEAEAVAIPLRELPIDGLRERGEHLCIAETVRVGFLFDDFRELSDEEAEAVGDTAGGDEADFAFAR